MQTKIFIINRTSCKLLSEVTVNNDVYSAMEIEAIITTINYWSNPGEAILACIIKLHKI